MNLLHNAFKNTPSGGHVVLRARAEALRLLVEGEDECGGIPQGKSDLFPVFGACVAGPDTGVFCLLCQMTQRTFVSTHILRSESGETTCGSPGGTE
jgi:hypothetical protein